MKQETFEYDVQLIPIQEKADVHPSVVFLRNTETGFRFVPARVTGITETGEISTLDVAMGVLSSYVPFELDFRPTSMHVKDLQYFGLKVHQLPETVTLTGGKREVKVTGLAA